jgi:hypothetical protein
MAKLRSCGLCGAAIGQNVAAHACPHGEACHYALDEQGLPVDWRTPSCMDCQSRLGAAVASERIGLTPKALALLEGR